MDCHCQKTEAKLHKEEAYKNREKQGAIQGKRLHFLQNLEKLAFKGWKDV
jgi:hypothetical protein